METTCDKCHKDFMIEIKVKKYSGGIEEIYFVCPHCRQRYSSYFTDRNIRIKQKQIMKRRDNYQKCINNEDKIKILKEIDEIQQKLKEDMNSLKVRMGK